MIMLWYIESTEPQIKPKDSTSIVNDTLQDFNKGFNENNDKFLSLAYGCRDVNTIIRKPCINGVAINSLGKSSFS